MCLFSQHDPGVFEQAGRLADLAHERGSNYAPNLPRFALTKAIADLRRGRPKSAIEMLEKASDGFRKHSRSVPPMLHLYSALAHAKLG